LQLGGGSNFGENPEEETKKNAQAISMLAPREERRERTYLEGSQHGEKCGLRNLQKIQGNEGKKHNPN